MKAFEERWSGFKRRCETAVECRGLSCKECKKIREEEWCAALKWARIKLENYTPEDICYFIDEELGDS